MGVFKGGDENINRAGKKPGTVNKTTKEIREAYQNLVEMNLENMSLWIAQIAAESPEKAMDTVIKLSEYILPKLARTEITGNEGEDLFKNVKFEFGPDVNDTELRQNPKDFDINEL